MATKEIEGAHDLPRYITTIFNKLQQVLYGVSRQDANKTIIPDFALRYSHRAIARVNKEEENSEEQKRKTTTGIIKVSVLSHKRAKKCDPRLAWEMFHKIYHMYNDIKNKEETHVAFLLTIMSDHKDTNKVIETTVNSHENHHNEYPFQFQTIVPPDLHQIQLIATQVWNCDEIRFDPNGKWRKVVCTYK